MQKVKTLLILICVLLVAPLALQGQIVSGYGRRFDPDSIRRDFSNQRHFGLYKDNYFIAGIPIGTKISRTNSDAKFQVSVSQRLTNATLPGGTFLYLFYTQKCFWNVFQNSMPMTDLNFNPGIGLTKPLFVKNRYIGKVSLILEHESNGRDSIWSRSWNKLSLAANIIIDPNLMVAGKVFLPIIDGENNQDILDYSGLYQFAVQASTDDRRFIGSITMIKRRGMFNFNYNTVLELAFRPTRTANQYLFIQYYNGYGEGLLDYKEHKSQLRMGIVIKPRLFSEF